MRKRLTLRVRDRDERHVGKLMVERDEVRDVEPAVKGRHVGPAGPAAQRKMQVVDVKMQHVELVRGPKHLLEHPDMMRKRVNRVGIEPERTLAHGLEPGRCHRIAAREQGDVVPLAHELFGQDMNDPLRAPVEVGRHALIER
jgi:hypothetical protein